MTPCVFFRTQQKPQTTYKRTNVSKKKSKTFLAGANMNALVASLSSDQMQTRVERSFRGVHDSFGAQSQMNGGCGLFTGVSLPLMANITRLINEWSVYAEKLRVLRREGLIRCKDRGFTDSQAKLIAFFFQMRVVFSDPPVDLLYGTETVRGRLPPGSKTLKGLWSVPVEEPENCQKPWPAVCELLSRSVWACDENPCTILATLFERKVQEMHEPALGFASVVLEDIEQVTNGSSGRFLIQLILNTQLYLRAASAFDMEHGAFMPDDLRKEMMDGIELVSIARVGKSNLLYNTAQVPKNLYEHDFGPFAECYVRLADESVCATCLSVGVANYIFPNFKELLQKLQA